MLNRLQKFDKVLIILLVSLLVAGMLGLYSAAYQKQIDTGQNFVLNQGVWILFGLMLVFVIAQTNYHAFLSVAYITYGLHLLSLILVLFMGKSVLGAQRWISIGGVGFQPSEFAKIFTILALARIITDRPQRLETKRGLIAPLLLTFIPMILIFKQPDLGTAIVFLPIFLAMLWVGGIKLKYFLVMISTGFCSLPFFWHFLKDYQRDRLLVFMYPNADPLGAGYTINQSKIAIGSGMFLGKGWLGGTQNQLNFLPERHTDFIFSVIGEEWGFVGTAMLLLLFLILIIRGFKIAELTTDNGGKLIAVGMTTMLALHVIINIGMTLGLMPVVGMPLPFISYGRSALTTNLIAIAFIFNVRIHRKVF